MAIEVTCLQCGAAHRVNDRLAGRRVRCPKCDTAVHVPEKVDQPVSDASAKSSSAASSTPAVVVEAEPVDDVTKHSSGFDRRPIEAEHAPPTPLGTTTLHVPDDDDEVDQVLPRKDRPEEEMDMTPMVDVTFLLLIFFMVTAAFSLQKSIEMPRQQTEEPSSNPIDDPQEDLDMVEVQVDEFGGFLVMAPDWERETPGKQNLILALKEASAGRNAGMKLTVTVHEQAKLRSLVDAMDAGTIADFTEIEVTQVDGFD